MPRDRETLERLPGVGRKTANVILNTAFGEPTIAVDTHIFRVANRTGLAPGTNVRAVEDELVRVTPDEFKRHAHHWLILHGRYVCKARKPECPRCLIVDLCEYPTRPATNDAAAAGRGSRGLVPFFRHVEIGDRAFGGLGREASVSDSVGCG